jgi:predicted DNA-binding transcriptional regulator AlpA
MGATDRRLIDTLAYPPRGMDVEHASAYVGLGRTKFLEMVEAGLMPRPVDLDGSPRWDRLDIDRAFDDLKEQRCDPRKAGRARIQARLDQQKLEPVK